MKKMKWILGLMLMAALLMLVATATAEDTCPLTFAENWTYDGTVHDLFSVTGTPNQDMVMVTKGEEVILQRTTISENMSIPQAKEAGEYTINWFHVEKQNMVTVTVSPRSVVVTWEAGESDISEFKYTYSGSEHGPVISSVEAQTATGESELPATISISTSNVTASNNKMTDSGSYIAQVALNEGYSSNYTISSGATQSYSIDPVTVTLQWTGADAVYDGQPHSLTCISTPADQINVGVVNKAGETVNPPFINADEYTATATLKDTTNYKFAEGTENPKKVTISPKEITLEWSPSSATFTYDQESHCLTAVANGVISGDTCNVTVSGEQTNAGENYTATATGLDNPNYKLPASATTTFSIEPKEVTLSWTNPGKYTYNRQQQNPTAAVVGTVDDDTCDPVYAPLTSVNQGSYTYEVTGLSNGNYQLSPTTTVTANYLIEPKEVGLSWMNLNSLIYNGSAQYPDVEATGLYAPDTCTVTVSKPDSAADPIHKGSYTAVATGLSNDNYKLPAATSCIESYVINPLTAELNWENTQFTYDGNEHLPTATVNNLQSISGVEDKCEVKVTGGQTQASTTPYIAQATELINNYDDYILPTENTTEFTISPKSIAADDVTIAAIDDQTYTGFAITPEPDITDDATGTLVEDTDYTLSYSDNHTDVGEVTITITGMGNYAATPTNSTTFNIVPKAIDKEWALAIPNQTYTGSPITPELTITDPDRKEKLIVDKDYTVTYADNINVAEKPLVTVKGIGNYEAEFTTTFVIDPKDIGDKSITIDPIADEVYTTIAIEPKPVVTDTDESKAAKLVEGKEYTVAYANNVKVSDTTELGAAQITITGTGNYTGTNGTTFIITRKPVKAITTTVNGPTEDTKRLGGPDSSKYHTITIDAQANEKMTVTIFRDGAVVTALKDFTAGDITIEKDAINGATLDGSGDVTYTVYAAYDDKDNLTTDEKSSRDSKPAPSVEDKFNYDTVAKAIAVHPLYNRAAKGVGVTLPEGYRLVKFTSSGAGTEFVATNAASLAAGDHVIPFDVGENPKLNSTAKGGTFNGLYEDYVGNPGKVDKQDILKAKGTIEIISVEPPINDSGRIGNTPNLIFTVKMGADGGYSELANGGVFGTRTLSQGEQQITVAASSLVADGTNTPSLSFDDLEGSATFRSFIFDPVCDEPVLTFEPYAGCYYLMGLAEPYSQIVIEVNGEKVTGSADAFGVFALKMPLTEEGDIISIRVTDLAGNVTTTSYRVGPEIEDATMTAFMAGRVYTNSHGMKGGRPDWTMILTASVDDLKAGNVNVPIIAGNMVSIGTMSVKMDGNNNLSYSYTLEDGVQVLNEKFIANTKLEKDAFIAGLGIEVSPNGTLISDIQKGKVYLSCKMNVKVPAEMLKTTFQTEKIKDSDLKKRYRDIQNGKLN